MYNRIIRNTTIWILFLFLSPFVYAQDGLNIEAPNNLELNCLNADYTLITSWLKDYSFTSDCQGDVRVTNDFDGVLPGVCGEPKFVKWIITNDCNQTDSAGAILTIDTDLVSSGFEFCPTAITVLSKIDSCGAEVVFPQPFARNCFGPISTTQVRNSNDELFLSGSEFDLGETEIVYIAEDECEKRDTCTFSVILIDSDDLISLYCPDDEDIRVCSNIDGCGWDSTGDLIRPGTAFLGCSTADITYRLELPSNETMTGEDLEDDDGDATGFIFPLGMTRLCYTISNSGGSRTCCFNIIVEDCTAPTIICPSTANFSCDQAVNQSSLNDWIAQSILDDNCDSNSSILSVVLDTVGICGSNEIVEFLFIAADFSGNENACVTSVNLTDDVGPEITVVRLPDLIMECKGIVRNQELLIEWLAKDGGFNDSHVINNCPSDVSWTFDPSTTNFQTETGACSSNIGFYDVEFRATDRCGNESNSARARLVFEDTTPPEVSFPDDLSLDCDLNNLESSVEMLLSGIMAIDSCSSFSVQSSFDINLVECEVGDNQLEVSFTASDACGNENTTMGLINLTKFDRSTITAPQDLVIRCGQDVDSLINQWLEAYTVNPRCDSIEILNNFQESQVNLCGSVQQVIWVLRDTCGAASTSTSELTIVGDNTAPVFLNCPNNVTLDVDNSDCTANFLFDIPVVEDCSGESIAIKQAPPAAGQPVLTSGSDFPIGVTTLMFSATDDCDNTSECIFNITVRNDPVCAQGGVSLEGNIESAGGENLSNVRLILSAPLSEFPRTDITETNGRYEFTNLPSRIDYTLELELDDDVANGLSTVDLVQIRNHIIGNAILNSPLQIIAADANDDNTLSAVDIVILQNIVIGFQDTLPNSGAWRFANKTEIENTTLLPWPTIDQFSYPNLLQDRTEDFVGVKVGDVNFSSNLPGFTSQAEPRAEAIYLETHNTVLESGKEYEIDFLISSRIDAKAFQMEFELNGLEFLSMDSDAFTISNRNINYSQNTLIINSIDPVEGFTDGAYLRLRVAAQSTAQLKDVIKISNKRLNSEIYVGDELEIRNLALRVDNAYDDFTAQVIPNPFSEEAILQANLIDEGWTSVHIFDSSGTQISRQSIYLYSGKNEISLSKVELNRPGIYYYSLHKASQSLSGKFIVIE